MRYEMPGSLATNALILSLFVHALLVTLFIISLNPGYKKFTVRFLTVKIVSPDIINPAETLVTSRRNSGFSSGGDVNVRPTPGIPLPKRTIPFSGKIHSSEGYDIVESSLYAIKAKKRIEKIVKLRTEIRTLQSSGESPPISYESRVMDREAARVRTEGGEVTGEISAYGKTVEEIIKSNWSYPEAAKKGLKSTVVVSVQIDGSIKIVEFKSSGERLFDYSVRNAILKSSPLPGPPEPLEIEMRFRND